MMTIDLEKLAELIRAAENRFAQAGACLKEGSRTDAMFCLRMAEAYYDLAKAMLVPLEGGIARARRDLGHAGPWAGHEMAQIVARSSEPKKEWETFERAYWEARKGEPIRESARAYMRGYRLGQAANKPSGR